MDINIIENSLLKLISWIEKENYKGYDPYDFLATNKISKKNPSFNFYFQQVGKFLPINLRSLLGIEKKYDPKALGLIALSYLINDNYLKKGTKILKILKELRSKKYYSWGLSFPWQSREFFLKEYEPNIVVTSLNAIIHAMYFEKTDDREYLDVAKSAGEYIKNKLNRYETNEELCFSYTEYDHSRVTDANLFAGALFSILYHYYKDQVYLKYVEKIVKYTKKMINNDGSIVYGYDSKGNIIRQYDYHQGFDILLMYIINKYTNIDLSKEILLGTTYYKKMFDEKGRALYRNKTKWPVDIHNQSVGILTFTIMGKYNPKYLSLAYKIAKWTIENMQDANGYFYYQLWPFFLNKIPYMRWSNAWMMLALSTILKELIKLEGKE